MMMRSLLGLTAAMLAALALLIGLGVWQLQRLEWKEGLIAKIETRSKGPAISLEDATIMAGQGKDPSYYRVRVTGRFDHTKERYLFAVSDGNAGWRVITPLTTQDGKTVLVDRGFVPSDLKDPSKRAEGQIEGEVAVTGIVRMPDTQRLFTPDNEPDANQWFWRDLASMAQSMFPETPKELAPFLLEAEKGEVPGGWPEGGQTRLEIPNNHLQYAITWFLLAACLVVIYGVYVWKARR